MALRAPSQNYFALGRVPRGEAEGTYRMAAGYIAVHIEKASVRGGVATNHHLLPVGATNI
jgi:hypothetical protein